MWKRIKQKTSDIFFEEVTVEKEIQIERKATTRDVKNKHVKMTYAYPKSTNFRFPVIPDDDGSAVHEQAKVHPSSPKRKSYGKKTVPGSSGYEVPVQTDRLAGGYRKQKSLKELENIPAFMRRQARAPKVPENQVSPPTIEEVIRPDHTPLERVRLAYTKPDELDRIFQKKDAVKEEGATVPSTARTRMQKIDHHIPAYLRRKAKKLRNLEEVEKITALESVAETELADKVETESDSLPNRETIEPIVPVQEAEIEQVTPIPAPAPRKTQTVVKASVEATSNMGAPGHLLDDPIDNGVDDSLWLEEQKMLLEQTLEHFNIDAKVVKVTQGPSVTRLEIQPAMGVRVSKIRNLADDIKLNMAAKDIRMEAPIPGKNTIGIEIPNEYPQVVGLQEIMEVEQFEQAESPLTIALGLTIEGVPLITDIEKMPHGLIAGATGSGKSVCINSILLSLLYKTSYHDLKLLLIDPKMVELTPYNGLPHLISPVITDAKAATMALKWTVEEMEERYNRLAEARVRNIKGFNNKMTNENRADEKMPYIVVVIDELADLMIVSPQEVEDAICRIAQKARACGIHLLVATQRPSVDVITGLIKANIPTRIAFSVSSQVDSRTMIDTAGAEKLLGKGDMLFVENGSNKSLRLQGPFVSDEEIDRVTNHFRSLAEPSYLFEQEQLLLEVQDEDEDELLHDIIAFVLEQNQASTSLLQRRFRIGYNRAARLIDTLELKGIISGQNGSKPREVLITQAQLDEKHL